MRCDEIPIPLPVMQSLVVLLDHVCYMTDL